MTTQTAVKDVQDTQAVPRSSEEEKAAELRRSFPSWRIWWGEATGEWLAMWPSWVKLRCGLVCDKTVDGLAAKITWIMQPFMGKCCEAPGNYCYCPITCRCTCSGCSCSGATAPLLE